MDKYLQVKMFKGDDPNRCNDFLKEIGTRVKDVKTGYNTTYSDVFYIVIYWSE